MLTRRKFLYTGVAATAGLGVAGVDGLLESNHLQVKKIDIRLPIPDAFDGFTIAQLSDFHYDEHFSITPVRKSVEVVNALHPDVIVLTGDFVTVPTLDYGSPRGRRAARYAAPCAEILRKLRAPMGKFAILGNHDGASDSAVVVGALQDHGIPVLLNRSVPFERGKARIWLAGIDDLLDGSPDLGATLNAIPTGEATILLAHEPDFADEVARASVALQLSGHSHGGQIWIPGIGAPWLPRMARKYPRGLYQLGGLTLYTNQGVGTVRVPVRLNCPPEVTLITLRAAKP